MRTSADDSPKKYVKLIPTVVDLADGMREKHGLHAKQQWTLFNAGVLALRDMDDAMRDRYIAEAMMMDRLGGRPLVGRTPKPKK